MNAVTIAVPPGTVPNAALPVSWPSLARTEMGRVARHPGFLAGLAAVAFAYAVMLREDTGNPDRLTPGIGAIFIGLVGLGVMSARARSLRHSDEVVGAAPTSGTARTAALCAACLVPFAAGVALWAFEIWSLHQWPLPRWQYAGLSTADHTVIQWSATAMAALGGPLLGVAVGRWLRFPGAAVVAIVAVSLWVLAVGQPSLFSGHVPLWATALRLTAPYGFFSTMNDKGSVDAFPGSPWWYVGWQLALCALAVVAALLKDAEPRIRRRLLVVGGVILALGLTAWVLAFTGGFDDWLRTFSDGSTQWGAESAR